MENNFEEQKQLTVNRELQMEEFNRKLPIWREQFGSGFADAINVLFTEIPKSEQGHHLFGEKKGDAKGTGFFGELGTFDSSWMSVVDRLKIMISVQEGKHEGDNSVDSSKDYWRSVKQRLLSLNRLFPESVLVKNMDAVVRKYENKIPSGGHQVYILDNHLQNTVILGQSLLIGNWAYWAEQKNLKQEGEDWKEVLFKKYNSPYVLKLLSDYLTEKISGISNFVKARDIAEWKTVLEDSAYYFQGYDTGSTQPFNDLYQASLSLGGNGMRLNPLAAKFNGNYLDAFIDHVKKQGEQGVVYDSYQLELLHVFANLLATHDHRGYPVIEVPVQSMMEKYKMEEVFNFKAYR